MCIALGAAVLGAGALAAGGSAVAGYEQAAGQEKAANTQAGMFNTIVGQEQPFIQGGVSAEKTLSSMLAPGGYLTEQFNPTQEQLNNYPGYQFALQQGGAAIRNADTAGAGAISGTALKDLTNFNVQTANQYYGQYFNQFQTQQNNIFNRLSSIAGLGQNAAGNLGNNGAQLGAGIAQAQAAQAGSYAGAIVGATNSVSNGLMLSSMLNQNAGAPPPSSNSGSTNTYTTPDGYTLNV